MQRHWAPLQQTVTRLVMWKDLLTGAWEGPDVFITWGRGLLHSLEIGCNFMGDTALASESSTFLPKRKQWRNQ